MKPVYVVDTHTFIWHLQNSMALSRRARQILKQVDLGQAIVVVPTIVLVEMIYLAEKKRIADELVKSAIALLSKESENYQLTPLDLAVVKNLAAIPRAAAPDMPDRLIAATALTLNIPLISRDTEIAHLPQLQVIW